MELLDYLIFALAGVTVTFIWRVEEHFKDIKKRLDKIQHVVTEKE